MKAADVWLKMKKYTVQDLITHFYCWKYIPFHMRSIGTIDFLIKANLFGVEYGKNIECYGKIDIQRAAGSKIIIGNNVLLVSNTKRSRATSSYAPVKLRTGSALGKILIDDHVGLNGTSIVARTKTVRIGAGTQIGPNVTIVAHDGHAVWPPEDRLHNPAFETDADVTIGKNVWIGFQTVILKGVTIGDNSVIGARSVVLKDIPSNVVAAGHPAKVIRPIERKLTDNG